MLPVQPLLRRHRSALGFVHLSPPNYASHALCASQANFAFEFAIGLCFPTGLTAALVRLETRQGNVERRRVSAQGCSSVWPSKDNLNSRETREMLYREELRDVQAAIFLTFNNIRLGVAIILISCSAVWRCLLGVLISPLCIPPTSTCSSSAHLQTSHSFPQSIGGAHGAIFFCGSASMSCAILIVPQLRVRRISY